MPFEKKILVVDDEEANVVLLVSILRHAGYANLASASDPRRVAALAAEFDPDLVLLDLTMPYLDGFAVMAQLRESSPADAFLPILVLTADATRQTRRRALAAGANDFLTKPFENEEVLLRCNNLLHARSLHLRLQDQNHLLEDMVTQRTRDLEQALTDLKASQRQNLQQERLRALGEMSGGVAHDFNNRLTVILGYSELLLLNNAQMLSNKLLAGQYLKNLNDAARESTTIVGRLREFSRRREVNDVFLSVDLARLVKEAALLTQPKWKAQAQASGRNIVARLELDAVPAVAGNAAELREALSHLILNAVDAMPQGGTITLRTRRLGDTAMIEVGDTGVGMDEEVQRRCLEPFFTTKGEGAAGMGLSMIYGAIKRHEGHLDIVSEPGKGTTFFVRLPAQEATGETTDGAAKGADLAAMARGLVAGGQPAPVSRPLRVLLVEDDPRVREVVSEYLRRDQHEVTAAVNGREGLEMFEAGEFDLVVTDLALDAMNGEQLAVAIKTRGRTPVILLTGFADTLLADGRKPDSVDVLLRKPLSPGDLWRAVAQVMAADRP